MAPRNAHSLGSHRYYQWRNEKFWSVTTIIKGGTPAPSLKRWGEGVVAEGAVEAFERGILGGLVEQDRDAAVKFLRELPYTRTARAADLGTRIHAAVEAHSTGKPMPAWQDDEKARMGHFLQFLEDYRPEFIASEATVYNRRQGYAGTFDGIAVIDGRALMLDMKTGRGIYPEVGLQLAAYRFGEFIGLPDGTEHPVPETTGAVALHLTDDGYTLLEVDAGEDVFRAFLYIREVHRWAEETSKRVLLAPLKKPDAPAVVEPAADAPAPDKPMEVGE